MSMDDPGKRAENGFIVVIVHIYRKMKMKTTAMNQSFCTTQTNPGQSCQNRSMFMRIRDTLKLYAVRWSRRYRLRNSLPEMNTSLVEKDVGLPIGSLSKEAHKPFWRE